MRIRHFSAGAIAILLLAGCSKSDDGQETTTPHNVTLTDAQRSHVTLFAVQSQDYHRTVDVTGAVDFDNDQATSVIAPFSGPVTRLLVDVGDHVRKGQALAMVDSSDFAAATSSYAKALVAAHNARRIADADKDLLTHNGVSQREAQQAETDAQSAEADRDAALQALQSLNVDPATLKALEDGRTVSHIPAAIRSPIDGTVAEKLVTIGQLLQAGSTPAFTVANLSKVWVQAQVFDTDIGAIAAGDHAVIETAPGGRQLSGQVETVAPLVNPDTRSALARVVVDNPGSLLRKGMYVHARIQSQHAGNGILVPVPAVLRDDENLPFVYLAQADGSFARGHVTLGPREGDRYSINQGLKSGDRIVTDGGLFLQFMQSQ